MSKTIVRIDQMSDGGINPETDITEDVLWTLHFDNDGGVRILGKIQMLTYLTAGTSPIKNVHSFKKWDIKTRLGHIIRTWVVVYDDKSHVQLTNDSFYALLMNGHRNKEEEKEPEEVADMSDDIADLKKYYKLMKNSNSWEFDNEVLIGTQMVKSISFSHDDSYLLIPDDPTGVM